MPTIHLPAHHEPDGTIETKRGVAGASRPLPASLSHSQPDDSLVGGEVTSEVSNAVVCRQPSNLP